MGSPAVRSPRHLRGCGGRLVWWCRPGPALSRFLPVPLFPLAAFPFYISHDELSSFVPPFLSTTYPFHLGISFVDLSVFPSPLLPHFVINSRLFVDPPERFDKQTRGLATSKPDRKEESEDTKIQIQTRSACRANPSTAAQHVVPRRGRP